MTAEEMIIKTKLSALELAKQLGNLSKACQLMDLWPRQLLSVQGDL